ncbi:MAG: DUF3568 family protein [Planctomycetota bacterium]
MICTWHKRFIILAYFVFSVVSGTGCIAAVVGGAAAAGGLGYAYYNGLLERNYIGPIQQVFLSTKKALESLRLPISQETIEISKAHLESKTSDGGRIRIWLEPVQGKSTTTSLTTKVSIRVDLFGDREISRLIFDEIDKQLGPSGIPPDEKPLASTPAILVNPSNPETAAIQEKTAKTDAPDASVLPINQSKGRLIPTPVSPQ